MFSGFWLSDDALSGIEPFLPKGQPGARRMTTGGHQRHHPSCARDAPAECRSGRGSRDNHLQPVQSLVSLLTLDAHLCYLAAR